MQTLFSVVSYNMNATKWLSLSVSGFLWVAWVQLDYIRKTFFQFKMSHCALCSPRSVHSFIVLSEDEGHNIRTLMFLTGLVDLGKRWTKRARTAKWHDSCWGRTLDGGSYTPKRSRAYITDHNQEMKKWRNHNSNHCSNQILFDGINSRGNLCLSLKRSPHKQSRF